MSILPPNSRPASEPWLVFDNRAALQAAGQSGMHAFITGVSEYPNLARPGEALTPTGLGMRRLSSTALTAYLIFDWLLRVNAANLLTVPLATCRLLLSANQNEIDRAVSPAITTVPPMRNMSVPPCNLNNFRKAAADWRKDAMRQKTDVTFFYFAGHGIQEASNQALLLEDFGGTDPIGWHMMDALSLHAGMAPFANNGGYPPPVEARLNIARTQFYFIDACRNRPPSMPRFLQLRINTAFDVEEPDIVDDRQAPLFFAALPEGVAQSDPKQQTLFSMALFRCFSGEAAYPPDETDARKSKYYISAHSLNEGFERPLNEINSQLGGQQAWDTHKVAKDAILCYLSSPPSVPISIVIDPDSALTQTSIKVKNASTDAEVYLFKSPPDNYPFARSLEAGQYDLWPIVDPLPGSAQPPKKKPIFVDPLRQRRWTVKV
jgi:hypothetical protein